MNHWKKYIYISIGNKIRYSDSTPHSLPKADGVRTVVHVTLPSLTTFSYIPVQVKVQYLTKESVINPQNVLLAEDLHSPSHSTHSCGLHHLKKITPYSHLCPLFCLLPMVVPTKLHFSSGMLQNEEFPRLVLGFKKQMVHRELDLSRKLDCGGGL